MSLPKLPGYTINMPPSGDKFAYKRQSLTYCKGYQQQEAGPVTAQSYVKEVPTAAELAAAAAAAPSAASNPGPAPQWIEQAGKVLRFNGYFLETVVESPLENHRVRRVTLCYYLEDDTLHLSEPRQDNSGIPQGIFLKRHKVFQEDGTAVTPEAFEVGGQVTIYGRTIYVIDADAFTRAWYADTLGKKFGAALPLPPDANVSYRTNAYSQEARTQRVRECDGIFNPKIYMESRIGKQFDSEKVTQYLNTAREVLRFYCLWDNRTDLCGDRRPYKLQYYLQDDTVDIMEINERNSGRDPFPVFLRRGPLPKATTRGTTVTGKANAAQFVNAADLRIGGTVHVLGREMLLHDCDEFTRNWYAANFGYTAEEMAPVPIAEEIVPLPKPAIPPYNGYGTREDSLQNVKMLIPKPPRKDMHKLMNKDKIILRFVARMRDNERYTMSVADEGRRFILSYFMMDDTIQVFEPPARNSGVVCGKFLERQPVCKPGSEETYSFPELYVGAVLEVHSRAFELLDADEYTYKYMENNKHVFIMADADSISKSLRAQVKGHDQEIRTAFIEMDTDGSGYLSGDELEAALGKAGLKFTRHQIIALRRKLDKDRSGTVSIEEFLTEIGIPVEA